MSSYQRNMPPPKAGQSGSGISAGIIISSMAVPPHKTPNGALVKTAKVENSSPKSSANMADLENHKRRAEEYSVQLKDREKAIKALEKELKDKGGQLRTKEADLKASLADKEKLSATVTKLKSENNTLTTELKSRAQDCDRLQSQLNAKKNEPDYKELYEQEVKSHKHTNELLALTAHDLKQKSLELQQAKDSHRKEMDTIQAEMKDRLAKLEEVKNKEIKDKDEKLQRMKRQMAETLTGNSHERQQQIDELTRELNKVVSECDGLRQKLHGSKTLGKAEVNGNCSNCKNLKAHLEKKDWMIKEKDRKIEELSALCDKFDTQLLQKDQLAALKKDLSHARSYPLK